MQVGWAGERSGREKGRGVLKLPPKKTVSCLAPNPVRKERKELKKKKKLNPGRDEQHKTRPKE